jgi:tRNA (guanine37-N1)-methyltransferase
LVGAKIVKGFSPIRVSTRLAFVTEVQRLNDSDSNEMSTISLILITSKLSRKEAEWPTPEASTFSISYCAHLHQLFTFRNTILQKKQTIFSFSLTNLNALLIITLGRKVLEAPCLKVPKNLGEKAIRLGNKLNIINHGLQIQQVDNYLLIPLTREPLSSLLRVIRKKLEDFDICKHNFPERTKRPITILNLLANKLPSHLLVNVPRAIDFVGDVAIIDVPPELEEQKTTIGEAILKTHKQTNTVLEKSGAVEGIYRLRDFKVIAGIAKTTTVHREHGCTFHVDIAKAYFSPRLATEHNRVASQVKSGETVVDLFAGVGPFSIQIAKRHEEVKIYAVDMNSEAITLLKKNIAVNRVEQKVVPILGDAKQVVRKRLMNVADRVIMNLPKTAVKYVDIACDALKAKGGTMHYYEFTKGFKPLETAVFRLNEAVNRSNRQIKKTLLAKTVREIAPYTWQVVVDAEIQ